MVKFIAEYQVLIFALVKILIMLGFFLNLAPVLVFVERRQAALIQDRVGPNRAVIKLPGMILKGALATPALLAGLAIAALCFKVFPANPPETGVGRGFWMAELATLVLWSHALVLAGYVRVSEDAANPLEVALRDMRDPRWIFYTGGFLHLALAVLYGASSPANEAEVSKAFALGGPAALTLVLLMVGGYLGYRIPSGTVELRAAGLLHSIADALKFAFKEDFVPPKADKLLHSLAPLISLFPALVTYAIIPFGDSLCFGTTGGVLDVTKLADTASKIGACAEGQQAVSLQIADLNVGILYLFAMAGTGIIGAALAGWSSDNKWSLLGGLRAASQMVSYEVAMGLSLAGAFMIYGTPRLGEMVRWQAENTWGIFVQPLAFFLFFAAAIAEQKRTPFDAPEGESEIIAGYFVEYSSFKFAMFYTGEYIELVTSSALLVTIFLGGWTMPFLNRDAVHVAFGDTVLLHAQMSHLTATILGVGIFFGKVLSLSFFQIFIRWTLPRFRYDQIMAFGWKFMLPAALGNIVLTGLLVLGAGSAGPSVVSGLSLLADASRFVVIGASAFIAVKFARLLLSPVERERFTQSNVAARVGRIGRTPETPMQA